MAEAGATTSRAFAALACACLLSSWASAQRPGGVRLRRFEGEARLRAELRDERRASTFSSLREREQILREDLLLDFAGYVYHPRLLEFDAKTRVGVEQQWIDASGGVQRRVDDLDLAYDLQLSVFKEHPYSGRVYSRRDEIRTAQTFFETTRATIMEHGAEVRAKEWWIPSRLHYHFYTYDGRGLDTNQEARHNVLLEGSRHADGSQYRYSIEFNEVDLKTFGTRFADLDAFASTQHSFGERDRHNWFNTVRYRRQDGDVESETRNATSTVHLGLLESLTADQRLEYDFSSTGGRNAARNETLRSITSLDHRLYKSLDTGIRGEVVRTDFRIGDLFRWEVDGTLAYRKETFFGRLSASYRADFFVQDEQSDAGGVAVVDEAHVVTVGVAVFLANSGVDRSTIVVSDASGLTIYTESVDYVVVAQSGRVRLDIPIGSRIRPGQTILVDYVFFSVPQRRFANLGQTATLGLRFGDFASLDFGWSDQRQDLRSGVDNGTLEDSTRRSARASVFRWGQTLSASWEDQDSSFNPFERAEYTASSSVPVAEAVSLRANASYFTSRFKGEAERERGATAGIQLDAAFGGATMWNTRAEYRTVDLRTDSGTGILFESRLTHRFRETVVEVELRFSDERFDVASDQRLFEAFLTVSRKF